jgi:hypothetical protein
MGNVQEEIIRLSRLVSEAEKRKDAAAVSSHLTQDYVGIDPSGDLIDKATLVDRYRTGGFNLDTLSLHDIAVRAQRDSAWEFGTMEFWLIAASQMSPVLR